MNVFEDLGALVALGAAFVSALAALYSRWQANAAKRANEIALHESRLRIYNGLARYRVHLTGSGPNIKEEEVWKLAEVMELTEFYFPAQVQPRFKYIFDESLKLLTMNEEWRAAREAGSATAASLVNARYELSRDLRDGCERIGDELKPFLRVGEA